MVLSLVLKKEIDVRIICVEVSGKVPGWEDSKGGSTERVGSSGLWGDRHISKIESKVVSCHRYQEGSDFLTNAELLRMRMGHICRSGAEEEAPWPFLRLHQEGGGAEVRSEASEE